MFLNFKSYRTSKGKLLRLLKPMRKEHFSAEINPIIVVKRGIDLNSARCQQFLRSDEVIAFLMKIGEPLENYERIITMGSHQMNKTRLKLLYPALSQPDFTSYINKCICEHRNIDFQEAVHKRYLLPAEVFKFLKVIGEVVDPVTSRM